MAEEGGKLASVPEICQKFHTFSKQLLTMGLRCTLKEVEESKTPDSLGTLSHAGFLLEGHPEMFFRRTHKCFIPFITSSK